MSQKGFVNILITIFAVVVAGALGYFFFARLQRYALRPVSSALPTRIVFKDQSGGCAHFSVYKYSQDGKTSISVSANKNQLGLSTKAKTFEIGKTDGLEVKILLGKAAIGYCDDVMHPDRPKPRALVGNSGKATIVTSNINESVPEGDRVYAVTVTLHNVHFVDEAGNNSSIIIDELIFKDVSVGWFPG